METTSIDKLLLNTAFCCMVIDSKIDKREIAKIVSMCQKTSYFKNFNFQEEINILVNKINNGAKVFISYYLNMLDEALLSEKQELLLIKFALNTIKADEQIKFAEVNFFKIIRPNLKISNEKILAAFPDIGQFIVQGKLSDTFLKKVTTLYLDNIELPKFDFISLIDNSTNDKEP